MYETVCINNSLLQLNMYWAAAIFWMRAARVPTIQMIKEYFGVAVVSEPWMAQRRS